MHKILTSFVLIAAATAQFSAHASAQSNPELEACRTTGLLALKERNPTIKNVSLDLDGMTVAKANTDIEGTPLGTVVIGEAYRERQDRNAPHLPLPDRRKGKGVAHVLY